MQYYTSLPGWKGTSGPPVTSTATTPANCVLHKSTIRRKTSKIITYQIQKNDIKNSSNNEFSPGRNLRSSR